MQLSERERAKITEALAFRALILFRDGLKAEAHEVLDLAGRMHEVEQMRCDFDCDHCHEGDEMLCDHEVDDADS
jgi:hypothetical protein